MRESLRWKDIAFQEDFGGKGTGGRYMKPEHTGYQGVRVTDSYSETCYLKDSKEE